MKRGKKIIKLKNKIILFSLIISISAMGVVYAQWSDTLTIDFSVSIGSISRKFDFDKKSYYDGDLYFDVSDDGSTLYIKGKVYPTFNENLVINFIDSGSLPSVIKNIHKDENNISTIRTTSNIKRTVFYDLGKDINSLTININPEIIDDSVYSVKRSDSSVYQDNISNIENSISSLNSELISYDNISNQKFKYIISYELGNGIWTKDLVIEGDIDVVPDPEVLSSISLRLSELEDQLSKEYEAEKLRLIEEVELLEEQKQKEKTEQQPQEDNDENINSDINEDDLTVVPEIINEIELNVDESNNNEDTNIRVIESNEQSIENSVELKYEQEIIESENIETED